MYDEDFEISQKQKAKEVEKMNQSKVEDQQERASKSVKIKSVWLNILFASVIVLFVAKVAQVVDHSCQATNTSSFICNVAHILNIWFPTN
jgi:threonine/homoserine/homoserine lactone efflux protein